MKKIILLILCLFPATLFAQSAMDYFHTSANYYVNADKKNAQTIVREGIQKFPNDQRLRNLSAKIDELPDPEDEQNQQNEQNQDNQEQQNQQQQQEPLMSQENAQQILNALLEDEKKTQEKARQQRVRSTRNVEKDW